MTNELKTYSAHIFELGCMNQQVYLKAEADKVIAELENRINDGDKDFEIAFHQNERLLQIVCHQKRRQCLVMAGFCRSCWAANIFIHEGSDRISMHYMKWEKRWLELAEKFKEAASGNSK